MNGELIWVLSLLAIAVVLFATGKVRVDAVALFVIVAFVLSGTLTLPEAFSGFSDLSPPYLLLATASCAPALLRWSVPGWLKWRAAVKSKCWFY